MKKNNIRLDKMGGEDVIRHIVNIAADIFLDVQQKQKHLDKPNIYKIGIIAILE